MALSTLAILGFFPLVFDLFLESSAGIIWLWQFFWSLSRVADVRVIIFRYITYGRKIIHSNRFVFYANVCQLRSHLKRCSFTFLTVIFSSKCSNFALECDWNIKISQIIRNMGFFVKKNRWFFSKIAKCGEFFV